MRVANDGQVREVRSDVGGPVVGEVPRGDEAPERVEELHVDEVRRMEVRIACESVGQLLDRRTRRQRRDHGGRVDDDHARSRPDRTAWTMLSIVAPPWRLPARDRTSATGGLSAI